MGPTAESTRPRRVAGRADDPAARGFGQILCAIDDSGNALDALSCAGGLAGRLGAELVVTHVPPGAPGAVPGRPRSARSRRRARELVERAILESSCEHAAIGPIGFGDPAEAVARLAGELRADLVVVGSRGRGATRGLVLGGVSEGILRTSTKPVLIVPRGRSSAHRAGEPLTILCGVDDTPAGQEPVRCAGRLASAADGRVIVAHVRGGNRDGDLASLPTFDLGPPHTPRHSPPGPLDRATELLGGLCDGTLLGLGEPASCLDQFAREEEADLLAVGSRAHGAPGPGSLGSTAITLIAFASRPVLVVPRAAASAARGLA